MGAAKYIARILSVANGRAVGAAAAIAVVSLLATDSAASTGPKGWDALSTELLQPVAEDGQLPNSSIPMALASDGRGFLWIGTQNGLARWDGQRFRIFNSGAGAGALPDSQVEVLHTDPQGRLWVGTSSGGLARYDPQSDRFATYAIAQGLSHVGVHALADAQGGGTWIGTEAGLDLLPGRKGAIQHIVAAADQQDARQAFKSGVTALATDGSGALWVGTPHGLFRRDQRSGRMSAIRLGAFEPPKINALMIASDGRVWIGTNGRGAYVAALDDTRPKPIPATLTKGLSGLGMRVRALLEPSPGDVWLGTYDDGLLAVDPHRLEAHRIRLGNGALLYGDENIRALHRGPGGLVFIASNSAVTRYDPRGGAFATLLGGAAPTATLGERTPVSILENSDGRIWLGYISHGVDLIDAVAGGIFHAGNIPGLPKVPVRQLTRGTDGAVLLATDGGLFRSDANARRARQLPQPGRSNDARVEDMVRDGRRLWVAGQDGVWRYRLGLNDVPSADVTLAADQLTDRRVEVLTLDPGGRLWIGTDNGLNLYDPLTQRVQRFVPGPDDATTPRGFISNVAIDAAGRIWVATFGRGLSVADPAPPGHAYRFRHIGVADGLPNANVDRVLEDRQGYIWASTDAGLARIDPRTLHVRAFQLAEGVPVASFFYNAGVRTRRDELLFAGRGGLVVVRPELLRPVRIHAPLVVTEVRVHGHVLAGDPFLGGASNAPLRLRPGDGGFEIAFAALDYGAPERVQYAYRLAGAGRPWLEADSTRRVASFSNLAPGNYRLEIRATDPSGTWPQQILRLPITVEPSWTQTVWFHILEVLLSAALVLLIIRWRTAQLHDRRCELEALVADRTRVLQTQTAELIEARARAEGLAQAKSDFLANMSHEIRTPLNGVVAVADLLSRSDLPEKARSMAEIIRASGDTLQRLLSDILDVSRIESGKITIEAAPFHLGAMLRSVAGLSQLKCDEKGVRLTVEIEPAIDGMVMGDMVRVRQVITNLLSNAVKFTERGEVRLVASRTAEGRARFLVTDTGVGFSMGEKAKVLGRFEQADSSITRRFGGTGLGLSICCDLVALMSGTLDCDGALGIGARFWMELPLEPATEFEETSTSPAPTKAEQQQRLRILLADDHPTNRKVVELMLDPDLAELTSVENGRQALDAFQAAEFDLILMDMQMPVMDGLTAIVEIRLRERTTNARRTPVIMLTANALPEHMASAASAGADLHLSKPFTAAALFQAIDTALSAADGVAVAA